MTRLPAYPLITHDPYFSIWHAGDYPTAGEATHWCGARKAIRGAICIDGVLRRYLGRTGKQAMKLTNIELTPLSTVYTLEDLGVRLKLSFTSPLLPDDLDILSTPITYIDFDLDFTDGRKHNVTLAMNVSGELCHSGECEPELRQDFFSFEGLNFAYMGQMRQKPLSHSGDHISCDWGYLFLASEDSLSDGPDAVDLMLRYEKKSCEPFHSSLLIGYDDIASLNYFGRLLPAYYSRSGKTITQALAEFHSRHDEIIARCRSFDQELLSQASRKGGEAYALIVAAAYRQSVAGHKLVADIDQTPLFISKENDSNGCAATVDISYPSAPLFLIYAPELVRAMCRPILKFAKMPVWHYDFAPHDVGRYPICSGQIYAARLRVKHQGTGVTHAPYYLYPSTTEAYRLEKQMPLEESANMLLLLAAAGYADGDWTLAIENLELLRKWCSYLLKYGEDPGEQLCTDDFTGHLSRNVNLSAKAFMGVAAFSMILRAAGSSDEADEYMSKARALAKSWLSRADAGGYTYLSFNEDGWSQKYNLVWDKLFDLQLLPDEFYLSETKSYLARMNRYGLPLDSRSCCTKTDWTMWCAAMADNDIFPRFAKPIAAFLRESPSRVAFSDFYDTVTGVSERMIARTVQGGLFMPLLMEQWRQRRSGR